MSKQYKEGDVVERDRPDGSKEYFVFSEATQSWMPREQYLETFPSLPEGFGTKERSIGLAQRAAIQGLMQGPLSIPAFAGDVAFGAIPSLATQALGGEPYTAEQLTPFSSSLRYGSERLADVLGKPRPETPEERRMVDYATAGMGGGISALSARFLSRMAGRGVPAITTAPAPSGAERAQVILREAGTAPGVQAAAATGAAAGADILPRFAPGTSPEMQSILSAGGGLLGGIAGGTVAGGTRAATTLAAAPFTRAGREANVGSLMRQMALNPEQSIFEMERYQPSVPGVRPLTAEASRDVGLAGAEPVIRSTADTANQIAAQRLANARVLREEMDRLARTADPQERDAIIARMQSVREQLTAPMRNDAFAAMNKNVKPDMARQSIGLVLGSQLDTIAASDRGAGEGAQAVLNWTKGRIDKAVLDPKIKGDFFRRLYEVRKDLREKTLAPSLDEQSRTFKSGAPVAEDVIRAIDDILDSAAGGGDAWKNYLANFSAASRRQERVGLLQDIQQASMGTTADVESGRFLLSAPAMARAIRSRQTEINETLTSVQRKRLNNVLNDLQAGAAPTAPGVRPPTSGTARNITMANFIGRTLGAGAVDSPAVQTLFRPLQWLSQMPEEQAQELLVNAMLDPKLAAMLMKNATPENVATFGDMMRESYRATLYSAPSSGLLRETEEERKRRERGQR